MPAEPNPVVFVHGYSDKGASWAAWRDVLRRRVNLQDRDLRTCTYVSLNNEVTIKDLAEAFDRALGTQGGLADDQPFDAIVHSTGMLVVRAWLAADPGRIKRLKRLIALAPATFGSPLAKKGRSWLGSVFKGNRQLGPDFLEAGDRILENLELASAFTWRLAEDDVFATPPRYDGGPETPYVFVFCGTGTYSGLRKLTDKPGTDGTVRRAGCGLNVRAIEFDMTEKGSLARRTQSDSAAAAEQRPHRIVADKWLNVSIPVHLVDDPASPDGLNHASILSNPPAELQDLVVSAFEKTAPGTDTDSGYRAWLETADAGSRFRRLREQYQQFIIHAVDERGDPITDYNTSSIGLTAESIASSSSTSKSTSIAPTRATAAFMSMLPIWSPSRAGRRRGCRSASSPLPALLMSAISVTVSRSRSSRDPGTPRCGSKGPCWTKSSSSAPTRRR